MHWNVSDYYEIVYHVLIGTRSYKTIIKSIIYECILEFLEELEASEPKWVNSDYILYGVNSLRLGGFLFLLPFGKTFYIVFISYYCFCIIYLNYFHWYCLCNIKIVKNSLIVYNFIVCVISVSFLTHFFDSCSKTKHQFKVCIKK